MKNNQLLLMISLFLFAALNSTGFAAIQIFCQDLNQEVGSKLEPVITAKFLATQDSKPIILTVSNTKMIQAGLKVDNSLKIDAPDVYGYQLATWNSTLATEEIDYGSARYPDPKTYFEIVVTHNNEVGSMVLPPLYKLGLDIRFTGAANSYQFDEISFNPKGLFFQFYFSCHTRPAPWLDSVTLTNPNYTLVWTGDIVFDLGKPPKQLFPEAKYFMTLLYDRPPDDPFSVDYMIFHFAGGIKHKIPLISRNYALDAAPVLKLLSPVGNEKIAPCEQFEIKWEGQNPEHIVNIQYSTDGKNTWRRITGVEGNLNSYIWTVPRTVSRNCHIRISQNFVKPAEKKYLFYDDSDINSADLNQEATKVLTAGTKSIVEYDIFSEDKPTILTLVDVPDNEQQIMDIHYLINNKRILALDKKNKALLYINSGDNSIEKSVPLPNNFTTSSFIIDSKYRFVCFKPDKYDNKLLFVDTSGKFISYYADSLPITNCYINENNDVMYISLLDNTIKLLSLINFPQMEVIDEINYAKDLHFNLINSLTVSQDSRLIGATFKHYTNRRIDGQRRNAENVIFDTKNNVLFKNLRTNDSTALLLDFNPMGTLAVLGYPAYLSQIRIMDLTDDSGAEPISFNVYDAYSTGQLYKLNGFRVAKTGNALLAWIEFDSTYPYPPCTYINFTLPEATTNRIPFSILEPEIKLSYDIKFDDLIIGTEQDYTFPALVCNTGEVNANFENVYFSNSTFKLNFPEPPLFLKVGECQEISVTVAPLDTGNLKGELIFTACNKNYPFTVSVKSLNRKLTLLSNPLNFGEVCIDRTHNFKLELFRNDDTIDVIINNIYFENDKYFKVVSFTKDTILKPGEIFVAELSFHPVARGELNTRLIICHSNQTNVKLSLQVIGTGVGYSLYLSHKNLPFIPEIRKRFLTLRNGEVTMIYIDSIALSPEGLFRVNTPFPLFIPPEQAVDIEIEYIGDTVGNSKLKLFMNPCASVEEITLLPYQSNVVLSIPQVEANPKDMDVGIPINFTQSENFLYEGERFFYSDFAINPRIFYPKYVESQFGKAELIKNEIINDKRHFGIKITGNFDKRSGELAQIKGVAGLCETDKSPIEFVNISQFFGKSVNVTKNNGIFQLIELCPNRFIKVNNSKLIFESISPNPTPNNATIIYEIIDTITSDVIFEVFDFVGNKIFSETLVNEQGRHFKDINFANLTQGSYRVLIKFESEIQSYNLNIIK